MTASYITAGVVSLALGIVTVSVERYQYWVHYVARRSLICLCLAGQALLYGGAGLLVAIAAHAAGAKSAYGESWLSGFVYGCVPHGLARVPLPGFPVQDLRDPKSPLGKVLFWVTQWLDTGAKRAVTSEIIALRGDAKALVARSWDLYWDHFYSDGNLKDQAKQIQKELLDQAVEKLDGEKHSDGIGSLSNFCIGQITHRYVLPPR